MKPKTRDDQAFIGRLSTCCELQDAVLQSVPLIYDTWCCVGAYLLKLFSFVLFLSCLHMVCVYVCFANLSWHFLSSQTVLVCAIFGTL